eukprot:c8727_g1_i2.p1 GENE.c8727_g1_i2~~c8727_g1_i2.p1  ORF type:complete len:173 (+),score=44.76 c8727_g1_i2:33-521(+)
MDMLGDVQAAMQRATVGPAAIVQPASEKKQEPKQEQEEEAETEKVTLDAEDIDEIDELKENQLMAETLRRMLADQGSFVTVCHESFELAQPIRGQGMDDSNMLLIALNTIAGTYSLDPVTEDEVEDLFLENLTLVEFVTLAQTYFKAILTTLDLAIDEVDQL